MPSKIKLVTSQTSQAMRTERIQQGWRDVVYKSGTINEAFFPTQELKEILSSMLYSIV